MISSNLLDGAWCISTHKIMLYMYEGIDQSVWKCSRTYRAMSESIFFNDICKGPSDALALKRPISLINASRVPKEKNPSEIRCKSYLSHWSLKHANTRAPSSNVSSSLPCFAVKSGAARLALWEHTSSCLHCWYYEHGQCRRWARWTKPQRTTGITPRTWQQILVNVCPGM